MSKFLMLIFMGCMCLFLGSCASERKVTYSENATEEGLGRYESDVKFVQAEDGSVQPNKEQKSQYDGKSEYLGNRDFRGENYATEGYRKKRWGGNKDYGNKLFGGDTDGSKFKYSPEFVQQQARVQRQVAGVSGQQYGAGVYNTKTNNVVQDAKRFDRPSDANTDFRRRVYKQPRVIEKSDYTKLSIEESNRLLGR